MVKEAKSRMNQYDIVLVASMDDLFVTRGSTRACNVLGTKLASAVDVVPERKEGVRGDSDIVQFFQPLAPLLLQSRHAIQ